MVGNSQQDLQGHPSRNMDRGVESNVLYDGLDQQVSEGKNISMKPRDHSCDSLPKNMAAFALILKVFLRLKRLGLVTLAEKISGQPNIDCVLWLVVIALMAIHTENERAGQREIQNVPFEEHQEVQWH